MTFDDWLSQYPNRISLTYNKDHLKDAFLAGLESGKQEMRKKSARYIAKCFRNAGASLQDCEKIIHALKNELL